MTEQYDVVVIGAGPAGYVAAIRCAQLGLSTACVDQWLNMQGKPVLGGTCLNAGCIPSKALLKNAALMHEFQKAGEFGFTVEKLSYDFNKIIQRSREVADVNSKGVAFLFKKNH